MTITPIVNSDAITWLENVMFENNTGYALCSNLQKHGSTYHPEKDEYQKVNFTVYFYMEDKI